jgi:nickel/cobalt exporter
MIRLSSYILAFALALFAVRAEAHPHVFVTVKSIAVYQGGALKAVKHAWRFDDMFSAFAVQGLDTDTDGALSRAELQALAEVNVTSLKEFDFFTFGKAGDSDLVFSQPVDYWLDHDGTALTLHFTLPVTTAAKADTTRIEIYDPTYFVSFALAKEQPATLDSAPDDCRVDAEGPKDADASGEKLTEDFFSNLDPGEAWGKQFANTLVVRCGADALAYAETLVPKAEQADAAAVARVEQAMNIAQSTPLQEMPAAAKAEISEPALGAFGVIRPDGAVAQPTGGMFGWIALQQANFYKAMSDKLSASKADGSAFLLLVVLSFCYGIFHAAGPGHGKAVISSYLLATGETLRRGIAISFAAAMAQAVTALVVVGIFAVLLGATSQAMGVASWWLEAVSYALIVALGVALLYRTSRKALRARKKKGAPAAKDHAHDHSGHSHGPKPEELEGEFDWKRASSAVLAIGLRPCTGALLILVFALAQGLIWAGIAATFAMAVGTAITVAAIATLAVLAKGLAVKLAAGSSRPRTRKALRLIEICAGFAVLAFGLMLLGGLVTAGLPSAG